MWRYSRHPNYFFQWMQWNALVLVSLPQLVDLFAGVPTLAGIVLVVGLAGTSACMYWCLVRYTGAVPAEYYSARKRPAYRDYQARVNRFVPWLPRAAGQ
nr:DUF1295 domain-containing protein [Kibdelosporangium sp. MJ126-NF4]CEL20351.1 FIG005069: Hypothetical protein [Kibdelosporangium sp. MJ126-NF4]CTQ97576.1 FIG005069: Hypothetical protein [Kibdelosporangium sp. MJ126-NF4]